MEEAGFRGCFVIDCVYVFKPRSERERGDGWGGSMNQSYSPLMLTVPTHIRWQWLLKKYRQQGIIALANRLLGDTH